MGKISRFIKKIRLFSKSKWKISDHLVEAKDISDIIKAPIDNHPYFENKKCKCIRDIEKYCLYITTEDYDKIINNPELFSKDFNILNLSQVRRYTTKRNYTASVYDRVSPPSVKIKLIEYISINKIELLLVKTIDLNYDDELFSDLVNYHKIERRY